MAALLKMAFAIFDIETRVDKQLLNESLFRGEGLDDEAAYERYRQELLDERGNDFFPISVHVPISIAIGSVTRDYGLGVVESLAESDYDEGRLVAEFWDRMARFQGCLVSFNGRQFDLPVLELQALRYGCAAPNYFRPGSPYRRRYAEEYHYDLYDYLTNYGAVRIRGGFDVLQRLAGLPGKGDIDGSRVQGLWEAGKLDVIHRYCRKDVIQTYLLLLRVERVRGRLPAEREAALAAEAQARLAELE